MNKFFIYTIPGNKFVTVNHKDNTIGSTTNIDNAAYWTSERAAKSWGNRIRNKHPYAVLKRCKLQIDLMDDLNSEISFAD